jgi:hypothetical protein
MFLGAWHADLDSARRPRYYIRVGYIAYVDVFTLVREHEQWNMSHVEPACHCR